MSNYVLLFIGCILVGLAYYNVPPIDIGNICNLTGIIMMVHGIMWDRW